MDGWTTNRFVLFTTFFFASLSESLWQKLATLMKNSVMEWFRLMTFCPCSLPLGKFVPPYNMGSSNFITGISQDRMSSILTILEKIKWHAPGPFQSSSSSSILSWIFILFNQGGRISLTWTVLDRMAPKRTILDRRHLNKPFYTECHLNGPFCSSWTSSFLENFGGKKFVGFWDLKKVEKFLEKCVKTIF